MNALCVLATSSVPPGIRGALNQWMMEVLAGVFVGTPPARVRDTLWANLVDALESDPHAYASLVRQSNCDQGFRLSSVGDHRYAVHDFDGIQLVTVRHDPRTAEPLEGLPDPSW